MSSLENAIHYLKEQVELFTLCNRIKSKENFFYETLVVCSVSSLLIHVTHLIVSKLSDVKDALDNMNAMNQHSAHMHLFGL
jgi:hypothetical protein